MRLKCSFTQPSQDTIHQVELVTFFTKPTSPSPIPGRWQSSFHIIKRLLLSSRLLAQPYEISWMTKAEEGIVIREVYFLLDWLSCQFCFQRPLKTKNLVLYGLPKTTKFKMHMLSLVQAIRRQQPTLSQVISDIIMRTLRMRLLMMNTHPIEMLIHIFEFHQKVEFGLCHHWTYWLRDGASSV